MNRESTLLDRIQIASPCSASWSEMHGVDRVRFCGQCKLNVYNLSNMTRKEAETLLRETEGRICVMYFERADGTILTNDCPIGFLALRRRLARVRCAVTSIFATLVSA